jgi:Domain of unknown function (DUF4864)
MRILVLLALLLIGSAGIATAAEDIAAAQSIIRSQEEALGRDDAAAAYAFASPGIQQRFHDPETFMSMVRNGYTPVYRHRSFEFGEAKVSNGTISQEVHIIDANGAAWEALYTLEPQPDGSLRISGCVLTKAVIS